MKMRFLLPALFAAKSLFAAPIEEVSELKEILPLIDFSIPETLVVFDIDNTLLQSKRHLGSVAWADHKMEALKKKGLSGDEAQEIINIWWTAVQPHTPVEPVDPNTPQLIKDLQNRGITVLCLTARTPRESAVTLQQLQQVGIELKGEDEPQWLPLNRKALFHRNVLLATPFNKKSEAILAYLSANHLSIRQLIFVDDKRSHVEDIAKAFEEKEIRCIGIRFSGADQQHVRYNPQIGEMQWKHFPEALSDEEAELLTR